MVGVTGKEPHSNYQHLSSFAAIRVSIQLMKTKNKRQKITFVLLLAVIALAGALLYINTLDRDELEEDLRMKVGASEFPLIFEDGDYANLDRARLIWTVNNLYECVRDFEFGESTYPRRFHINGREVETNRYLLKKGRGNYGPVIKSSAHKRIGYYDIIVENGVQHLVLSRQFIEAFIDASSKYGELTDEINNFIERLNRINSTELNKLTEAEIDTMLFFDPTFMANPDLEDKKRHLRTFTVDKHFQSTNVFWVEEGTEKDLYSDGDDTKQVYGGSAIFYRREDDLRNSYFRHLINPKAPPPLNLDPRLHNDPDAEPFIWVPVGTWEFINVNRQWKIALFRPGT